MRGDERLGLHNLRAPKGATSKPTRKGRGPGSGRGKTAGRGQKGQKSRSGSGIGRAFEGGQMPLVRRVPKRGFTNPFRAPPQVVNVRDLALLEGEEVSPETLAARGLVRDAAAPVKILGSGDVTRAYQVSSCKMSASAKKKIEEAGGRIQS